MKILVTGAAGFIGGQLWHTLWKRGDEVVGIDNFSYGNPDNLKFDDHDFGAEVRRMDIRDKAGMLALFEAEKFDVVYNIAGIAPLPDCQSDPVQAIEVNTLGLVNLLPIPGLDGCRILFVLFEMIFRRPVNRKVEAYIHLAGYLLLLGVMVYFTFHDVINIFA